MALPRSLLHIILFLQSVFLYWAVLRFSFRQFLTKNILSLSITQWVILKPNIENASRLRDTAGRCRSASAEGKRIVELGVSLYHMSIDAYCLVNPQLHTTFIESLSNPAKNQHFEKKGCGWCWKTVVHCDSDLHPANPIGGSHKAGKHTETGKYSDSLLCQIRDRKRKALL